MPVLLGIFALFVPRLVILVLWFFTGWLRGVFDTLLWPIAGLVFALLLDVGQGRGRSSTPAPPRHSRLLSHAR